MLNKINKKILDELIVYSPINQKFHFGCNGDGGYVIIDGYDYDYFISCGIENNVTFENDFCNYKNYISGLAFDGTVNRPSNLSNNIDFLKINISCENTDNTTNLNEETKNYKNIFIKMDIESHEWKWLKSFNNLNNCKQIILEVHGLFDERWQKLGKYEYEDILLGLEKINKTHFLVHFHGNNCADTIELNSILYPSVGELTFIRKNDCLIDGFNKLPLPSNLDYSNNSKEKDIDLNFWPFVFNQ
jgi:hypothetical protein